MSATASTVPRSISAAEVTAGWISLGPDVATSLEAALRREWLVTNGLGGYAAGTVAGISERDGNPGA